MNQRFSKVVWTALGITMPIVLIWLMWRQEPDTPPEVETWRTIEDVRQYLAARGLPLHVPPHSSPDFGILTLSEDRARQNFSDGRGVVSIWRFPSPGEAAEWAFMRPTDHLQIGSWYLEGDSEMLAAIASRLSSAADSGR